MSTKTNNSNLPVKLQANEIYVNTPRQQIICIFILRFLTVLIFQGATYLFTVKKGYILINSIVGLVLGQVVITIFFAIANAMLAIISIFLFIILIFVMLPLTIINKNQKMQFPVMRTFRVQQKSTAQMIIKCFFRTLTMGTIMILTLLLTQWKSIILLGTFIGMVLGQIISEFIKIQSSEKLKKVSQTLQSSIQKIKSKTYKNLSEKKTQ